MRDRYKPYFSDIRVGDWHSAGTYQPVDRRVPLFFEKHTNLGRVLELSCFEGGHTLELSKRAGEVLGVDGRQRNVDYTQEVLDLAGVTNTKLLVHDCEKEWPPEMQGFDVIFCCGFLYHMENPAALLKRARAAAPEIFLSTHVGKDETEHEGYRGAWYNEPVEDPRSGLYPRSFWPTPYELVKMLQHSGYGQVWMEAANDIPILHGGYAHQGGDYVIASAKAAS